MFVKLVGNNFIQYPADPKIDNPSVSFPDNWEGGVVDGFTYARVNTPNVPSVNLGWQAISNNTLYKREDNKWYTTYSVKLQDKNELLGTIANHRYTVETGGVVVNNCVYSTDRDSQTKYASVSLKIDQMPNTDSFSINWKVVDISTPRAVDVKPKFVTLNAQQFKNVADLIYTHVQKVFDKEAEYFNLIQTANTEVLEQTDFSRGWLPANNSDRE
jgi:hypothetical protein